MFCLITFYLELNVIKQYLALNVLKKIIYLLLIVKHSTINFLIIIFITNKLNINTSKLHVNKYNSYNKK